MSYQVSSISSTYSNKKAQSHGALLRAEINFRVSESLSFCGVNEIM